MEVVVFCDLISGGSSIAFAVFCSYTSLGGYKEAGSLEAISEAAHYSDQAEIREHTGCKSQALVVVSVLGVVCHQASDWGPAIKAKP